MKSYAKKLLAVTLASGTLASPIASASSAADTVKRNWKTIVGAALMGTGVVAGSAMIIVWLTKDSDKDALILDKLTADEKAALLGWKDIPVYCPSDLITANKQLEEGIKWVLNLENEDFAKITSERGNAKIEEIFSIYPMPSCMQIGSEVLRDLFATPESSVVRCKAILLRGLIKFATRIYAMGKVLAEGGQKGNETFKFALKAIADLYVLMNKEGIELSEREKVHKQTILIN